MDRNLEMKNYLYLTWLEIWAFTFWYNDNTEKHYRFDQMLDVLDKVIHHEMNIFNLMFDVLNKHGEPQMMLKLYQKLLQLKINPSTFIYNIISNILDKKQIKNLAYEMKKNSSKQLKFKDYYEKNNRERTFLSINDNLPLDTKQKFYYDYLCISCNQKINL
jgi:pentatricopeptide repeat protein